MSEEERKAKILEYWRNRILKGVRPLKPDELMGARPVRKPDLREFGY